MTAQQIGRYRIKKELGRGGMATVYLAHDPRFDRDVAIKLLPHELLHQPTFRARFGREAKIVATLDHPAIVPVYDFGEQDGQPFLVMRYMAGSSLADRLQETPFTLGRTLALLERLAPALDEAHAAGIVHRDLKPSNILFDQWDKAYISDFGTAKITAAHTKLTDTGDAVGTPAYMSPEQIRGNQELDGRSDVYTLGILTFEMLTGRHPYQTDTPLGFAVQHIIEPVPPILEAQPDLPPLCQPVISRAMAKDPAARFPNATAFATALARATTETLTLSLPEDDASPPQKNGRSPVTNLPTVPKKAVHSQRLRPLAVLGVLALLVLLIGGGRFFANNDSGTAEPTTGAVAAAVTTKTTAPTSQPTAMTTPASLATKPPATATDIPTASPAPTETKLVPTKTATATPAVGTTAVTTLPSSIFAAPDADAAELAILAVDEEVLVLGRSESDTWFYVQDDDHVTGYVYHDRLDWSGVITKLPIINPNDTGANAATPVCTANCPPLTLDSYPLPGSRCTADLIYRTVYMVGHGGSGVYTYYWNNELRAGPLVNEGYGFEVNNQFGPNVIGTVKVISSDGQTAEKELFISDFRCD